jgi:nucleoside-diphosphate-sugar epimerase
LQEWSFWGAFHRIKWIEIIDGVEMASVLVTGASGFVGGFTVSALLAAGWDVRGTARVVDAAGAVPMFAVADLGDMKVDDWLPILAGVDVVVHLAGRAHVLNEVAANPLGEFRRVNTEGSKVLMRAAIDSGVKRLVFVSSIGVNGDMTDEKGFSEGSVVVPHKDYAVSKYEAELALQKLAEESGVELVIVRPPLVYGVGVKGNFARLLELVAKGLPLPLGLTNNRRTLVGVENLASFLVCCAGHPRAAGELFLVGDDESLSTGELVRCLGEGMDKVSLLLPVPAGLALVVSKTMGKQDLYKQLFGSLVVNNGKAKALLGWVPKKSARDELRKVGAWYVGCKIFPDSFTMGS